MTPSPKPILGQQALGDIRQALTDSGYTTEQIETDFPHSVLALAGKGQNGELAPLIDGDTPQHTLMRLFLAAAPQRRDDLEHECGLPVQAMLRAGILKPTSDDRKVRAEISIQPHDQWWVFSDIPPWQGGYCERDAVLPVRPVSCSLAHYTVRDKVDTALDIGTGCGMQALHLNGHASSITATDLSPRALQLAATTAALNEMNWELLHGDLTAPVAGRRFDLVVSALPVSVGPGLGRWMFRDSDRQGADLVTSLAGSAQDLLTENGVLQFVAHWPQHKTLPWESYPEDFLAPRGMDTWITRHATMDAEAYVDDWLSPHDPLDNVDREKWLAWLQEMGITSIGFGMVTIRQPQGPCGTVRVEEMTVPSGEEVAQWIRGRDWMSSHTWHDYAYQLAEDVLLRRQEQNVSPHKLYERGLRTRILRWAMRADADRGLIELSRRGRTLPATRLALDICGDATRSEPQRLDDLLRDWARSHGQDLGSVEREAHELVTRLVERGILLPDERYFPSNPGGSGLVAGA